MRLRRQSGHKTTHLWLIVIFVVLFALSFKFPVGQKLSIAMAPLVQVAQVPVQWYDDFSLWFKNSQDLQTRYMALDKEYVQQKALALELQTLKVENRQLRRLLKITAIDGYLWRAARVISRGQEIKSRRLMLQVQKAHEDDIVVSDKGLVGLVDNSGKGYAVVRTILDASLAVPVTLEKTGLAGLVRGDGEHLIVDFVPLTKAPKVGDILTTSGAGGLFPAGLPVAKVEEVRAVEGGVFAEVLASPAAYWQRDAWLAVATRTRD